MNLNEITIGMLKESRPELVKEIEKVLTVSVEEKDKKIGELESKVKEQEKIITEHKSKLDIYEVKEKLSAKKEIVEKALKESK